MRNRRGNFLVLLVLLLLIPSIISSVGTRTPATPSPIIQGKATGPCLPSKLLYINPSTTPAAAVGSSVTIQVKVACFDQFNAWDISVVTDPSVLNPTAFTVPGFGANATTFGITEFVHCINGGATPGGATGCGINDASGIVHSAIAGSGTPPLAPVDAVLFTITYSVAGTGGSYVHIFNDGLSLGGVTISHTTQDGVYSSPADFSISYAPTSTLGTYTVTATSLNAFAGSVALSASSTSPVGLATSLTSPSIALTSGASISTTLKVSEGLSGTGQPATPTGFYNIALSGSTRIGGVPESRSVQIASNLVYTSPASHALAGKAVPFAILVKAANIDPFNGWDIAVKTDPSFASLVPESFSITPNLLAANFSASVKELIHCVNGVAALGSNSCVSGLDGPGVVHSQVTIQGPVPMTGSTDGVLFNITYTGTGTRAPGSIFHFDRASIANGTPTTVLINSRDGLYGNPSLFSASISTTSLTLPQGASGLVDIALVSLGPTLKTSFKGAVTISASLSPPALTPPTTSVGLPSVILISGGTGKDNVTVHTTASTNTGFYVVKVNATAVINKLVGYSQFLLITVFVPDFKITAGPASPNPVNAGSAATSTVTATSLFNFAGPVTVTSTVTSSPAGAVSIPTLSPSSQPLTLTAGSTAPFTLTMSTTSATTPGFYSITVTGVSGGLTHSAMILLTVQDFTISASAASPNPVTHGSSATSTITLTSLFLADTVTVTSTVTSSPGGAVSIPTLSPSPQPVTLTSGGTGSFTLTMSTTASTTLGTYTITVTGVSSTGLTHSTQITVTVQ